MIVDSCNDHSMPGCDECTSEGPGCPTTLRTAATVCNAHDMDHCAMFNEMCDAAGDGLQVFCDPSSDQASYDPPMRMYFHKGARGLSCLCCRQLHPRCVSLQYAIEHAASYGMPLCRAALRAQELSGSCLVLIVVQQYEARSLNCTA